MATHTGSEGTVRVGASNAVLEIRSYSVEETADTVEDTSMGDSYRTFKTTLKGWSGSVDVFWDETDATGQGALVSMIYNRGNKLDGDRRKEMRAIVNLVAKADYEGIADQIERSKRLWENVGLAVKKRFAYFFS